MKKIFATLALTAITATSALAQGTGLTLMQNTGPTLNISGYLGGSYDFFSVTNANASRTGATSEQRVSDQSSRITFNVADDLGNGLTALGQFDLRFKIDAQTRIQSETTTNPTIDPVSSGNNHVGLKKAGVGTLRLGRQDIYYNERPSYLISALFQSADPAPVFHSLAQANGSRTPNLIWFESDRFNGFQGTVGYSTQPLATSGTNQVESSMGTQTKTGNGAGTYAKLNYVNGPLDLTYATINFQSGYIGGTASSPNTGAVGADANANKDQFGQTLLGKYDFGNGFKGALGYSKEKLTSVASASAVTTATSTTGLSPALSVGSTTTANALAASGAYTSGPGTIVVNYAKRGNLSYDGTEQANTGIKQMSIGYQYELSKSTAVGIMHSQLKSDSNVGTGMWFQGNNAFGGQMVNMLGETQKMTSFAIRTTF